MAAPMVSSAKGIAFGDFNHCVASFCMAGMAFPDIQMCFPTCGKSFCLAGAILLRNCQKMSCIFGGMGNAWDVSLFILRCKRSTLEESC